MENEESKNSPKVIAEALLADIEAFYGEKPDAILFGFKIGENFGGGINGSTLDIANIMLGLIAQEKSLAKVALIRLIQVIGFDKAIQLAMSAREGELNANTDVANPLPSVVVSDTMTIDQANEVVTALVKKFPSLSAFSGLISSSKNNQLLN